MSFSRSTPISIPTAVRISALAQVLKTRKANNLALAAFKAGGGSDKGADAQVPCQSPRDDDCDMHLMQHTASNQAGLASVVGHRFG